MLSRDLACPGQPGAGQPRRASPRWLPVRPARGHARAGRRGDQLRPALSGGGDLPGGRRRSRWRRSQPAAGTLRVYGGPESLLTLADEGLLGSRPVLLNADGAGLPAAGSVVTDSLRRRVRNFGELRTSYSPTLTATQPARTFEAADDYTEPGWDRYLSVARVPRHRGRDRVLVRRLTSGPSPASGRAGCCRSPPSTGTCGPCGSRAAGPGRSASGSRLDFDSPVDPGTISGGLRRQALARAAGRRRSWWRPRRARSPTGCQVTGSGAAAAGAGRVPSGWLRITVTGVGLQPARVRRPGGHRRDLGARGTGRPDDRRPAGSRPATRRPWCWPRPSRGRPAACSPRCGGCAPALTGHPTEEQYGFDHAFTGLLGGQAALHGSAVLIAASLAASTSASTGRGVGTSVIDVHRTIRRTRPGPRSTVTRRPPGRQRHRHAARPHHRLGLPRMVGRMTIQRPPGAVGPLQVLIAGSGGQVRGANVGRQRGGAVCADADDQADVQVHLAAGAAADHRRDDPRRARSSARRRCRSGCGAASGR